MPKTTVAAVDLGATSGRIIVGQVTREGIELTEAHRFPNSFRELKGNAYWEVGSLYAEMRKGLTEAKRLFPELACCGIDTWGVDHVITNSAGRLAFPVHAYRDVRTNPIMNSICQNGDDRRLFDLTGIPMVNYNSGLQLAETLSAFPGLREVGERVMMLPDYFNFLLSGKQACEFSHTSTTQLLDVRGRTWSAEALSFHGIPSDWFLPPQDAGSLLGPIKDLETLEDVQVALVPGHDTSCAFEAIPREGNSLIISCGTWMLVGGFSEEPFLGDEAFAYGISNERTGQGDFRPTKILLGLWLLERIIPQFDKRPQNDAEWSALISAASERPDPETLIDTADKALFNPKNMQEEIDAQIRRNGGTPPEDLPGYVKLICASLGASVQKACQKFESIQAKKLDNIVIVGGGSKNALLCQMIADHSQREVTSFSLEATSVGNMAYQLLAMGKIASLGEFHEMIRPSLSARVFKPGRVNN